MSVQSQQNTQNKQQQPSVGNGVANKQKPATVNAGAINMGRAGTPGQNPNDRENVWKDDRKAETNKYGPNRMPDKEEEDNAA